MNRKRAAARAAAVATIVGLATLVGSTGVASAGESISGQVAQQDSRSHAGYSTSGRDVTRVEAEWTIPSVDCSVTPNSRSSIMVSFDDQAGQPTDSVGTSADCHGGKAHYYGWYQEMDGPRRTMYDPMQAGDRADAGAYVLNSYVDLHLNNYSAGTNDRATSFPSGTVAVWAKHKPASHQLWPLSDFGTVYFTDVLIDQQPIADGDVVAWRMVGTDGAVRALPSGLHDDGSFAVLWRRAS